MESGGKKVGNKKIFLAGVYACVCVKRIQNKVEGHLHYYLCI